MDTDDDPSSCSIVHLPLLDTEVVDSSDDGYDILEHISLEYPSQTVCKQNNNIIVAPNTENTTPYILSLKFDSFNSIDNFKHSKTDVKDNINRIKIKSKIYAITDKTLEIFDSELNNLDTISINQISRECCFSYGIDADEIIAISTTDGNLIVLDKSLIDVQKNKIHLSDINDIKTKENMIYSCSNDRTISVYDRRSNSHISIGKNNSDNYSKNITFNSELNAIDVRDNKILVGEDDGNISLLDLRKYNHLILSTDNHFDNESGKESMSDSSDNRQKYIDTFKYDPEHRKPITSVSFYSSNNFISTSDDKVCLWDISLKESIFDHDGQEYYKQGIYLEDNIFVVTSIDGLCFFKPDIQK
ncbi:WD repeat-containing protein [Spraguea lophii 42_110]|uniref:WD repeat-containing protein n=1 Tax=Spraguea lophii (strain 42_110) TaxID=1358809 RepID=S7XVY2_SPRLO|nr:WD repeat-containing protein [Spraguea lophii 42_110]